MSFRTVDKLCWYQKSFYQFVWLPLLEEDTQFLMVWEELEIENSSADMIDIPSKNLFAQDIKRPVKSLRLLV